MDDLAWQTASAELMPDRFLLSSFFTVINGGRCATFHLFGADTLHAFEGAKLSQIQYNAFIATQ